MRPIRAHSTHRSTISIQAKQARFHLPHTKDPLGLIPHALLLLILLIHLLAIRSHRRPHRTLQLGLQLARVRERHHRLGAAVRTEIAFPEEELDLGFVGCGPGEGFEEGDGVLRYQLCPD